MVSNIETKEQQYRVAGFNRGERLRRLALVAGIGVIFMFCVWWLAAQPLSEQHAINTCSADYKRAFSSADSGVVDRRAPIVAGRYVSYGPPCFQRRNVGQLHRH